MKSTIRSTAKSLTRTILRTAAADEVGREADHGFDCGEWSNPAHDAMLEKAVKRVVAAFQLTVREAVELLTVYSRTCPVTPDGQFPPAVYAAAMITE